MKSKGLHPNNRFKNGYNFDRLIKVYPKLQPFCKLNPSGNLTIDFSDVNAVRSLNTALLLSYDGISYWRFPKAHLCPPIPGRLDYILHVSDLIGNATSNKILDIGTGATCIYPLLGVLEFNWHFVASEIDSASIKSADKIISKNKLSQKIELRKQHNKSHILQDIIDPNEDSFHAVMCNPPFYKSQFEASTINQKKSSNLGIKTTRNFSGTPNELWYPGGEKAFLHNYMFESKQCSHVSQWFTSLVSQKENLKSLQSSSKKLGVKEFVTIPMQQGNKLTRIVAWRF